ncbi:MAG: DUF924 domain-containing protein [Rhodocyclales bacterium GT-UBC]|nr:MAG: DUF924 domain-containing protein [Rhodocyclales bacterium GT-UBC]
MPSTAPADILAFWFGLPGEPGFGQPRREWFAKDATFDERIRSRFLASVEAALAGRLAHWMGSPKGVLALLILLDQFPRNLFRNQDKAFAGDQQARLLAEMALDQGWEKQFGPLERVFLYLPFEHSERLADQERAVALFSALAAEHPGNDGFLDYARRHHEVIARFGRFPHRNAALGRDSTPDELDYLAQPGSGF